MNRKFPPLRVFVVIGLAQAGTALFGCADEPDETVECADPCEPDIRLQFTPALPDGEHSIRLVADPVSVECTFEVVAGQVASYDCGQQPAHVLDEGFIYYQSPKTFSVEHTLPNGCVTAKSYSPDYHKWYSAMCDISCSEWDGMLDFSECATEGFGGMGGNGAS